MMSYWNDRAVVVLYAVAALLYVVDLILIMTINVWLFAVCCVIVAIVLCLVGLLKSGYVKPPNT